MAKAQNTFEELREFWRAAYSKLPDEIVDLEPTFKSWVEKILTDDGLTISSQIRQLFLPNRRNLSLVIGSKRAVNFQ